MHKNILSFEQVELLPILKHFNKNFYLVGGTAIALHIGHRRSIDFDLFTKSNIRSKNILEKINDPNAVVSLKKLDQLNLITNQVKMTFFNFPYNIPHLIHFENIITMPDLLTLAAMKAFALGRRAKWKDYVDLYFIIKDHFKFEEIVNKAKQLFVQEFVEKQFRAQLGYFKDVSFDEPIEYITTIPPTEDEIKEFLFYKSTELN